MGFGLPSDAVAAQVRSATAQTRDERTARIWYERTQDLAALMARAEPRRESTTPNVLRWLSTNRRSDSRISSLIARWERQQASGVIDFRAGRCLLEFGRFKVLLDDEGVYLPRRNERGWEYSKQASRFLGRAGPFWLFDLASRAVSAREVGGDAAGSDPSLRRFEVEASPPAMRSPRHPDHESAQMRLEAWVDGDGRIRRLEHASDWIVGAARVEFCEFGRPPSPLRRNPAPRG